MISHIAGSDGIVTISLSVNEAETLAADILNLKKKAEFPADPNLSHGLTHDETASWVNELLSNCKTAIACLIECESRFPERIVS